MTAMIIPAFQVKVFGNVEGEGGGCYILKEN